MWKIRLTPFDPFPPTSLLRPLLLLAGGIWVGSLLHTTFSPQTFLAIALSGAVASFAFGHKSKKSEKSHEENFANAEKENKGIGKGRERLAAVCAAVAFVAAAISLTLLAYSRVLFPWSEKAEVRVVQVENVVKETADEMRCDVTVRKGTGEGHKLRLTLEGKPRPQAGDLLAVHARVSLPGEESKQWKGYRDYLVHHGISGIARVGAKQWKRLPGEPPLSLRHRVERLRRSLAETYRAHFEAAGAAFFAALTLGDRSSLSPDTRELFSQMGVAHVLALSGLHLGVLFSLFRFFVRRDRMSPKLYLTAELLFFLCLWFFVFLAGASLSLQRAATMFTLMQLSHWFRRGTQSGDNLCLAAFLILLFSPFSLFDLGFQLSVLSVVGILAGQHFLWSRLVLSPFHPFYTLLYSNV
ncbi:MAG: ComEC/Rec2 family competence protein, partial [Alloprevotella sp.]